MTKQIGLIAGIVLSLSCAVKSGPQGSTTSGSTTSGSTTASHTPTGGEMATNDGWREPTEKRVQCNPATAAQFAGVYDSPEWGTMVLRVVGDEVWGAYLHDEGVVRGRIVNGAFLGWWNEVPSRQPNADAGEVQFCITADTDGRMMVDGSWMYGSLDAPDRGSWSDDWDLRPSDSPAPAELEARFSRPELFLHRP